MGVVVLFVGGWPILISAAIFLIAVNSRNIRHGVFFFTGFVSITVLAAGTFFYFSAIDIPDHSGAGAMGDWLWIIRGVRTWAILPGVASLIAWAAAKMPAEEGVNCEKSVAQKMQKNFIRFNCPDCRAPLKSPAQDRGHDAKCKFCSVEFVIPNN